MFHKTLKGVAAVAVALGMAGAAQAGSHSDMVDGDTGAGRASPDLARQSPVKVATVVDDMEKMSSTPRESLNEHAKAVLRQA